MRTRRTPRPSVATTLGGGGQQLPCWQGSCCPPPRALRHSFPSVFVWSAVLDEQCGATPPHVALPPLPPPPLLSRALAHQLVDRASFLSGTGPPSPCPFACVLITLHARLWRAVWRDPATVLRPPLSFPAFSPFFSGVVPWTDIHIFCLCCGVLHELLISIVAHCGTVPVYTFVSSVARPHHAFFSRPPSSQALIVRRDPTALASLTQPALNVPKGSPIHTCKPSIPDLLLCQGRSSVAATPKSNAVAA